MKLTKSTNQRQIIYNYLFCQQDGNVKTSKGMKLRIFWLIFRLCCLCTFFKMTILGMFFYQSFFRTLYLRVIHENITARKVNTYDSIKVQIL